MEEKISMSKGALIIWAAVILAALVLVLAWTSARSGGQTEMMDDADSEKKADETTLTEETGRDSKGAMDENTAVGGQGEQKTINISGANFRFSMDEIRVKEGDTVKIIFKSDGGFHDWVVDEFDARTARVNTGEMAETEFIAGKKGAFEFYCSVGQHRQMGMVGRLIVE